ncbi:MAG: molybdopterin cofactor-binding domain-containing protein, partial [Solirubrobacteraceae bacterium]
MTAEQPRTQPVIDEPLIGYGSLRRKEDARFIRGQGRYVDDVQLPDMVHGAILRSPWAHARIASIDASAALQHPKILAVLTGSDLEARGVAWMPTMSGDVQAVLATDKVRFQGQEVAFVVAADRYSARDALELIDVEYEPLGAVVDPLVALDASSPLIRDDIDGQRDNRIFDWESGDRVATERLFASAELVVEQQLDYPRSHPAPLETCGAVAEYDRVSGKVTLWCTTQAPHAHRTLYAQLMGIPEHLIRVISPDVGGGFGNKVPVYPGYICAMVAAISLGRPVKWMEDRSENLMSTGFARDYKIRGALAADRDGRLLAIRADAIADHGAFNSTAQPSRFPAGFFDVFTGSYELQAAYCHVTGAYTNKAPGGVAYACSFRIAEAVYVVERLVDRLAGELGVDPAELRLRNLIRPESFTFRTRTR